MIDYRIICNLDKEEATTPTMPLIIVMGNGIVGEAKSIRGLISLLIEGYADAEDATDDWNLRVKYSRSESMKALAKDLNVIVYDRNKGIINNNYAAAKEHPDYEAEDDNNKIKIYVDTEKDFLKSLIKLDIIKILERKDSYQLKGDENKNSNVTCRECSHRKDEECIPYKSIAKDLDATCESGTRSNVSEYSGGKYIEIKV